MPTRQEVGRYLLSGAEVEGEGEGEVEAEAWLTSLSGMRPDFMFSRLGSSPRIISK